MKKCSLALAFLVLLPAVANAQQVVPPASGLRAAPGVRVRLTHLRGATLQGLLVGANGRTLSVRLPADDPFASPPVVEVPVDSLSRVEISTGKKRHALAGAIVGAVLLGVSGFADPVDPQNCGQESAAFCSRGEAVAAMTLGGAVLGALVGHAVQTERWTPIGLENLDLSLDVGASPRSAALTAGVRLRF